LNLGPVVGEEGGGEESNILGKYYDDFKLN
jgi:hypothetical protein